MSTPREHIESIRKNKYQIGVGTISVSRDLRMAVKYLSTELYSKDVHFLMELIQNAEDNKYAEGVEPSLEFLLTSEDITATGAPMTLLVLNNEKGFTRRNMDSICSIGDSSKTGKRKRGYIGEKGIGFKSVFLLTSQPYIFSNGYQVRFSEQPCPYCDIAYIVPEWVDQNPTVSDLKRIYGGSQLPTTTIILPLKRDKVDSVKEQLSSIHREMILFLSKIKKLSVKETNHQSVNSLHAISISSERDFVAKKNIDAQSFTLHLTSFEEENGEEENEECSYYMWRQRFPVKEEHRVERRMEVDEWSITLAFPYGQRLNGGMMEAGIYAFLPTEMVTNFPFIIQADFILQSSREKVVLDDPWNKGILSCVPTAFMDAFTSLVKCDNDAPLSSLARLFAFLPVKESSFQELNDVRKLIKQKVVQESIVPSESLSKQRFFHKPSDVGRVAPAFWNIVLKAKEKGVNFHNLSSHGKYILSSSLVNDEYKDVLAFLGVDYVDTEWYSRCIQSSNLVLGVDDNVYIDLLVFISGNWSAFCKSPSFKSIPLMKYVASDGTLSLLSIQDVKSRNDSTLCRSQDSRCASWLIKWSKKLKCAGEMFFLPEDTQVLCSKRDSLLAWLRDDVGVTTLTVYEYSDKLCRDDYLGSDRRLLLAFSYFLHRSLSAQYLSSSEVERLCKSMQLIDSYRQIVRSRRGVLVPANGSIWVQLMNSNPWKAEGYVELHEDYLRPGYFGGRHCSEKQLNEFLRSYVGASDIPDITPPNVALTSVSAPLTKDNALILLGWIRKLRSKGIELPSNFLRSIKEGRWLRVSMNGSTGYRSPCQSFLHSSSWGALLQNASVMLDIPIIDQAHYDYKLSGYEEELKAIGVMSTYGEACEFIGEHLMNLAASSSLSKNSVMAMLGLISFLREKYLSPDRLIASIKRGNWLRTSRGFRSPIGSVLFDGCWKVASEVSLIPFIDQEYYGEGILHYKKELELLEVIVKFNGNYQIVKRYLKPVSELNYLSSAAFILLLKCIRHCASSNDVVAALKAAVCIKTNSGFRNPSECFFRDPEWGCILQVFDSFPYVDSSVYGRDIELYTAELRMIGVVVDYDNAVKAFVSVFKQKSSRTSFTKDQVFKFLDCYRNLSIRRIAIPDDLEKCITDAKWLRTRLASQASPKECILFGQEWESIAKITTLPFIDDSEKHYGRGIHDYKAELESVGVVVDYKKGANFVVSHIYFPGNADGIAPGNVYSLLNSIRRIKPLGTLPEQFLKKVCETRWLKTTFGYRSPAECILYDKEWKDYFTPSDGPFIDENHFGSAIVSYREELQMMGVVVDVEAGASLLVSHLPLLSHFESIKRVYLYLDRRNWVRNGEASDTIWIPFGNSGKWVSSADCVLYNKNNLFSSRLIVLEENQYDSKLLKFFGRSFGVRSHPSMEDYCELWKDWESSSHIPSHDHCCAFWSYVVTHWNSKTEKVLSETLNKVPAYSSSGKIHLIDKRDAFIPDDLLLKDLFCNSSNEPLFVWTPRLSHLSIPRSKLLEVYRGIGIRTISSSVVRNECFPSSTPLNATETRLSDVFIKKGLIILVLGFLADPVLDMNPVSRHETVQRLLKATALETSDPIAMSYCLSLSSGSRLSESASRMIYWDRNDSKLFVQKLDRSEGMKNVVEFATNFAQVISEGLLWDKEDHIPRLSELIKFAFLVDFDVDAVNYYMKSKNLQMFAEDEELLSSVYASE